MTTPLVSVLIPCYNAERRVGESLESVLSQTWTNIEVIVIDDGSTDGSVSVVNRYSSERLQLVHTVNRGPGAARNEAFRRSRGAFIQFFDADDLLHPRKIEAQMERLRERPDCVASSSWAVFQDSLDEARFIAEPCQEDMTPIEWLVEFRLTGSVMGPPVWLVPRHLVEAAGPWREDLTLFDDPEFFTRVLLASKRVLFCEDSIWYYRKGHSGNLSGRKSREAFESAERSTQLCQSYMLAREDSERVRRGFSMTWQQIAYAAYPYDREFAERALANGRLLHRVVVQPGGGLAFKIVSRLLGWRIARRLQVATGRS